MRFAMNLQIDIQSLQDQLFGGFKILGLLVGKGKVLQCRSQVSMTTLEISTTLIFIARDAKTARVAGRKRQIVSSWPQSLESENAKQGLGAALEPAALHGNVTRSMGDAARAVAYLFG